MELQTSLAIINNKHGSPRGLVEQPGLEGLEGLTEENRSWYTHYKQLNRVGMQYGLEKMIRWTPQRVRFHAGFHVHLANNSTVRPVNLLRSRDDHRTGASSDRGCSSARKRRSICKQRCERKDSTATRTRSQYSIILRSDISALYSNEPLTFHTTASSKFSGAYSTAAATQASPMSHRKEIEEERFVNVESKACRSQGYKVEAQSDIVKGGSRHDDVDCV